MKNRKMLIIAALTLVMALVMSAAGCSLIPGFGETSATDVVSSADLSQESTEPKPIVYSHSGHEVGDTFSMTAEFGGEKKTMTAEHIDFYDGLFVMDYFAEEFGEDDGFSRYENGGYEEYSITHNDAYYYDEAFNFRHGNLAEICVTFYREKYYSEQFADVSLTEFHEKNFECVEEWHEVINGVDTYVVEMSQPLDESRTAELAHTMYYFDIPEGLIIVEAIYSVDYPEIAEMMAAMIHTIEFPNA